MILLQHTREDGRLATAAKLGQTLIMNRKDRRRQQKQGKSAAPSVPPPTGGGFGGADAMAMLTGRRTDMPLAASPPTTGPSPSASPVSEGKIASSVYFKAMDSFRAGRTAASIIEAVRGMREYVEQIWAQIRPGVEARKEPGFACAAGCAWCCYQQVSVTPGEAIAITNHLTSSLSPPSLDAMREKVAALDDRTRGLGVWARAKLRIGCAFLDNGRCSIYAVRPLRCRGVYSRDADHCHRIQDDPDSVYSRPIEPGRPGPYPVEPAKIVDAALVGLMRACQEFGLNPEPLELTAAVRIALAAPGIGDHYAKGESVFAGAELPARDDNRST